MSAASGASTAANAASGELGARGRRSSLTDDRCTLVADDRRTTRYQQLLRMTGLTEFIGRRAGALSGGMKRRLLVAKALGWWLKKPEDYYEQDTANAASMVDGLDEEFDLSQVAQELQEPSDLLESDDDAPIIRLINAVLTQAVKENASDIHIEPFERQLRVRFRMDGMLYEMMSPPLRMKSAITVSLGTPSSVRSAAAAHPVRSLPVVQWNTAGSLSRSARDRNKVR